MTRLSPITEWKKEERANIRGVFTDIDDTLTTNGRVPATAFLAMERLRNADFLVVPVTGRPAGWCDMIARTWPVDAVVGENGALAFRYDPTVGQMRRLYADRAELRTQKMQRLEVIRNEILDQVPAARVSADQVYRETDLAIDIAEDVTPLNNELIDIIVSIFKRHDATVKVSSIHINGWFGNYSKLTMTHHMMSDFFNIDLDISKAQYVFIGDSPNDSAMFGYFTNAVGVANLHDVAWRCESLPTWITRQPRTSGFIELAESLLDAQGIQEKV